MGGTQFNGLALVHELVRTGHDVTILNRGHSQKPVPRSVRRLYADRTDHEALRKALEGCEFDCVHDVSAYRPEDVKAMTEILRGRTGHYVFASSTVIYAASKLLLVQFLRQRIEWVRATAGPKTVLTSSKNFGDVW